MTICAILDDDSEKWRTTIMECPVAGAIGRLGEWDERGYDTFVAIGDNAQRKSIVDRLNPRRWGRVIHDKALVDRHAAVAPGVVVCAGAVLNPNSRTADHAIINTSAVVEHDVIVGSFSHVAPHATLSGCVRVGEGALIGAGCVILPGILVGPWARVGAGSVVTKDVPTGQTVAGNPARVLCRATDR